MKAPTHVPITVLIAMGLVLDAPTIVLGVGSAVFVGNGSSEVVVGKLSEVVVLGVGIGALLPADVSMANPVEGAPLLVTVTVLCVSPEPEGSAVGLACLAYCRI